MLERLRVANLGIIREVELEFGPGLTVLTGETGAGKSLLVGSLKLLAGGRAVSDLIRSGASALNVEGTFRVEENQTAADRLRELGVPLEDGVLLVRREMNAQGRSRAWLNDVPSTAAALQSVATALLSIHGQHEQHGLADPLVQRRLVDEFAGHGELLDATAAAFARWEAAEAERRRLENARAARRDRLDAIAFQLAEIDRVAPRSGEDEELTARRSVLRNGVRLGELGAAVLARLGEGERPVVEELARARRELEEMSELGLPVADAAAAVAEAAVLAEEALREVSEVLAGLEHEPEELERVESRLHALENLMLKYGSPLEEVLAHRRALLKERAQLEALGENLEAAREAAAAALGVFDEAALRLQRSREDAGERLLAGVAEVLAQLGMEGTRLRFRWEARPDTGSALQRGGRPVAFDGSGVEQCELLIAPNRGEELRPMARIASGGELSRLHLALRTVLRRRHGSAPMTLLFDEVDSGLGGATAAALGALLVQLAATDQVLVVTHLPQVAALAARHYLVSKGEAEGRTVTSVAPLDPEQRVEEVARMLSGRQVTHSALEHARSLMGGRS